MAGKGMRGESRQTMTEKVGAIFEIIDDASPKLQTINAGITEVNTMMSKWDNQINKNTKSSDKLGKSLITLNSRFITSRIGIIAFIATLTKLAKEMDNVDEKFDVLDEKTQKNVDRIKLYKQEWELSMASISKGMANVIGPFLLKLDEWNAKLKGITVEEYRAGLQRDVSTLKTKEETKAIDDLTEKLIEAKQTWQDYTHELSRTIEMNTQIAEGSKVLWAETDNVQKSLDALILLLENGKITNQEYADAVKQIIDNLNQLKNGVSSLDSKLAGLRSQGITTIRGAGGSFIDITGTPKVLTNEELEALRKKQGVG